MGATASGGEDDVVSDINVTPLVDVTLVILIVFMITFPTMAGVSKIKVDLAETKAVKIDKPDSLPLTVYLKREGQGYALYSDAGKTNEQDLRNLIISQGNKPATQPTALSVEQDVPYGEIMKAMDLLGKVGIKKISFNTKHVGK